MRGASTSRRTFRVRSPVSRSSVSPIAPARRRRNAFGAGSRQPRSTGRCGESRSISRQLAFQMKLRSLPLIGPGRPGPISEVGRLRLLRGLLRDRLDPLGHHSTLVIPEIQLLESELSGSDGLNRELTLRVVDLLAAGVERLACFLRGDAGLGAGHGPPSVVSPDLATISTA